VSRRVLFGSYELLERIGEGGMAEVWRARSRGVAGFEKTVVIKRVLPTLMARKDFATLLVREAKIAARLNHPNVVQIFELGEEQGAYYIAMEYVHGCDLATAVSYSPDPLAAGAEAGLGLGLRIWIACEAAKALDYAHRKKSDDGRPLQIVHRDVSPQNVLLGYEGQVKLSDFGIALADERGLGRDEDPGMIRGKYAYMSPEQTRGETLDNRSDIFSLGIVLHEMLAGRRLFRGNTRSDTLQKVREQPVPEVDAERLGLPPLANVIVTRCLARDRDARYPSAGDLAEDLSKLLVEMNAHVDDAELATALQVIAPPQDAARANKLRVDLLLRATEDATLASTTQALRPTPVAATEATHAFPTSKQIRADVRAVVVLMVPEAASQLARFADVCAAHGGRALPPIGGLREAVFGHTGDGEHAAGLAARAALELRRQGCEAGMVIVGGEARVYARGGAAEPLATTRERGATRLGEVGVGEIWADPNLEDDLSWRFHLTRERAWPCIDAARARSEREMGAARTGPLIGRGKEMKRLTNALEDAAAGEGDAVLLLGPPGSGKSRVLAELHVGAQAVGAITCLAHGKETDAERPFAALADLLADLCGVEAADAPGVRAQKTARLRVLGLSPREVAMAGELLGADLGSIGLEAPPARAGRPRGVELVVALRKALRALSCDAPVLLCFEDVHWMDDGTRQLLDVLVRGFRDSRVLCVLSARPGAALPHLNVETLVLDALDEPATGRLFASRVHARGIEDELQRRVVAATDGIAGWVCMVADELGQHPELEIGDGIVQAIPSLAVPARMRALVGTRVTNLSWRARNLLRAVAAFPEGVDLATLAAVEGIPKDVAERPVQTLLAAGLCRGVERSTFRLRRGEWGGGGGDVAIPPKLHVSGGELSRRALLESLDDAEQQRLHARIVSVLRAAGAATDERVEALAYHAVRAGDFEHAPAYLARAAELDLEHGSPHVAAERFAEAARVMRRAGGSAEDAAALAIRAASCALEAGDTDLAEAVLLTVPRLGAEADPAIVLKVSLARAQILARREHWPEVVTEIRGASDAMAQTDESLRGEALVFLGRAHLESGDLAQAVSTLHDAAQALESAGEGPLVGAALCGLAIALARAGEDERAADVGLAALTLAVRHGGGRLRWASLSASAEIAEARGDAHVAAARWEDAAAVAREHALDEDLARTCIRAAVAYVDAERESEAAVWASEAAMVAKQHKLDAVRALADAVRALVALSAHPELNYVTSIVRSVEYLEALGRPGSAALALGLLARAHLALDDVGAAIRTLGRAGPLARAAGRLRLETRLQRSAEHLATGAR